LTKRETEVLALIAAGYTSRAIASRLTLSAATVDTHRRNLMSKIGAHNAADLVLFAINEGLITAKGLNR
jgi:DNA-binding NarL/FixJ family response regulator